MKYKQDFDNYLPLTCRVSMLGEKAIHVWFKPVLYVLLIPDIWKSSASQKQMCLKNE